ncbi:MAG: hypothetical protein DRP87_15685 [Spirochaetes bacterium]|nr:MAG: hypothetical protein DRP87_15685 [Spirochaetota bacterium]
MIGKFLIKEGYMTEEQVEEILKRQTDGDNRLFGEIAVDLGYLTPGGLVKYIMGSEINHSEQTFKVSNK